MFVPVGSKCWGERRADNRDWGQNSQAKQSIRNKDPGNPLHRCKEPRQD